ncbi:MAG: hypothetical protein A2268_10830 [Candidatus Raymondbacteria bacterium RifOxyA12_full_50_37]|uniref:ABC-type transport auxiliary lipoprotein component domain-containing protein n=1 Tax=Candidatus Raymondbacteria bacterium RIFOXYD12_FULL_49_13 TaxID=1817890 RepID=A0A1F7FKV6_UNCRA|nr:MAG: hypothetical protein A2268_10830 [Candidatus Raymondbacteria bacterium RifOxyA12_full_50_37]OGJ85456.1 MAG: hypothetical protein A2248_12615 [Candidatus Raymondbacteria bacterium RIFOXYA2_FULL_49_16]OGJ94964.1 MAG: hypothetical protein A2453_08085 [Candidatus Raymondbacteria bacterium RIFOXYC2_FULL_50_21]OGJ99404.1 MAG: hypothetical protein A2350_08780 [Candidatus Raymondbacteria bacterium RifOxyB12_full_50_8]OGK01891.1 MAG: hypothetical protein A2487_11760 [Candidatus Raymondbacteria b
MRLVFVLAACLALAGCSGKISRKSLLIYFEPAVPAASMAGQPENGYPFKLQVKRLKLTPLYDNAKVITRTSDYTVDFANNASWAIRPDVSATDLLVQTCKSVLLVKSVRETLIDELPDYVISGDILVIEEDERGSKRKASLAVELRITKSSGTLLFEKKYKAAAECDGSGYTILAERFSILLADIYGSFIKDAISVFNKELTAANDAN